MSTISWDVGIKNLAYCILDDNYNILSWDIINLVDSPDIICKGSKYNGDECDSIAKFIVEKDNLGFCRIHKDQYSDFYDPSIVYDKFIEDNNRKCWYVKKNGDYCGKKSKYGEKKDSYCGKEKLKIGYCNEHYKSIIKKRINEMSLIPLKKSKANKVPTVDIQKKLIEELDRLIVHFSELKVREVIIENQPSFKNPKMKAISATLFDYFLIRGYNDKSHGLDIKLVKFFSPSNKLKVNEDNTIEAFKNNKDDKRKYKLTKDLSIKYTKKLLEDDDVMLKILDLYDKKDDLCDCYLQGLYYLQKLKK